MTEDPVHHPSQPGQQPDNPLPNRFESFYSPHTSRVETVPMLEGLQRLNPTVITDTMLFSAIADTFATLATEEYESGEADEDDSRALEWEATDEVSFETSQFGTVFLGLVREPEDPEWRREETAWIQLEEGYTREFQREADGTVHHVRRDFPEHDVEEDIYVPEAVPDETKTAIVSALLEAFSSQAPVAAQS